jgi:hypothetical protein
VGTVLLLPFEEVREPSLFVLSQDVFVDKKLKIE